jgi:hypothetical protein
VAARKTTRKARARKRTTGKKTPRKAARALRQLEADLPPTLREFSQRVRRGLVRLEKIIERERQGARRRAARLLREASHRLGELEARGEREWRTQSRRARTAAVRLLRQLERAIEPRPAAGRKKKAAGRKKKTGTRVTARRVAPPLAPVPAPERAAPPAALGAIAPERTGSGV